MPEKNLIDRNIDAKLSSYIVSDENSGTHTYTDSGGEQTIFELTETERRRISAIWLDGINITKSGVIKTYYKVDGVNYREVASYSYEPAQDSDGIFIEGYTITNHFKLTYTENEDEGGNRDIHWQVIYDIRE